MTPQIGGILDRYIDPIAEKIFLKVQSSDQLGFTKKISYLMGAIERGECQRWALDRKLTCFGVSFDGQAAFPSVDRDIQIRELYSSGEQGQLLQYSRNIYQNTASHIKSGGKVSREFREYKGSRQGHKRASGHFKSYINPCLLSTNSSELGFNIGPICVSSVCIADDTYILSDDPRKLQGLIDIVGHYGKRYRLIFGPDKTKVTITGSNHDMQYYEDTKPWSLYGQNLVVSKDNEHLGLIVSGTDEESKNVDKNIESARNTLFGLLGQTMSYKCKLSPEVQLNIWSVYIKPALRSGLASLPVRPPAVKTLASFHLKILRGILKLSSHSPILPLHFLLGEPPIEAALHLDIMGLFWNTWANPQTKIHDIVKYIIMMSDSSSLTWSAHLRTLFIMYNLPDPLALLQGPLWPKQRWKDHTRAAVTSYHERQLREKARTNHKLEFLNVQTLGLSGKPHPTLTWIITTQDVVKARIHTKMLAGDYMCYDTLSKDRGSDPQCRLCLADCTPHPAPAETMTHLVAVCRATENTRTRILPDLLNIVAKYFPSNNILKEINHSTLTQFVLDPTSFNSNLEPTI